ncbi:respiratory nitrate reductase subunit gamma [Streptomyces sp. APSN-46.1]|uniref:respiratory nitrate reductase subunit gamma n=1 Tax=Streptomyces sp. APSN-46.1 TaxID=2929049 RepID=UPI001FB2B29D|nr:respiratory nitrate reductase subunit gamma [Streptomyces sp. APSN-46.1]MCJ1676190.1 respiratory nitrate reductase subunit gamma [Streptomyces sp. APSN-46.1]
MFGRAAAVEGVHGLLPASSGWATVRPFPVGSRARVVRGGPFCSAPLPRATRPAHHRAGIHGNHPQGVVGEEHNYRETVSPWFRSVFTLQPDNDAMAAAPLSFQLHRLMGMELCSI